MTKQVKHFSSIVTFVTLPEALHDNNKIVSKFTVKTQAQVLSFFLDSLVRCSASNIYLLSNTLNTDVLSALPKFLQPRIKWIDQDKKILLQVTNIIRPIHHELEWHWKEKRGTNPQAHEHGVCILIESLHILTTALRYNAEADLDFNLIKLAIKRIKKQITSQESSSILARIEGIFNAYSINDSIEALAINSNVEHSNPGDLLNALIEDSEYINLSETRYFLGIPNMFKKAAYDIKKHIKHLLNDNQIKNKITMVKQMVNIATEPLEIPFEIPGATSKSNIFSPPIISLDELRSPCILGDKSYPTYD